MTLLRNFILGKNRFIPSHLQFKRIVLTGQLCLVTMMVCSIYMAIGLYLHLWMQWIVLVTCFSFSAISFILNRNRYYAAAKIILALTVNLAVFFLCFTEPFESGQYTFFIVCGLSAMTAFGQEEKGKAIFFVCLSTALFVVAMIASFDYVPDPVYTPEYIRINIIINFFGCLVATILVVYFLMSVNHHSESELRNNELQIQLKNQELVKLNTELDRFVYSTSHDLRAPISSIQGLIQLTRMTDDPQEVRNYIEIMHGRLGNLTKFIGDISDYARNARIELNNKPVDVTAKITEILDNLKFYPGASNIVIQVDVPSRFEMVTDPIRLHIILSNLISNAIKYADHRRRNPTILIAVVQHDNSVHFIIDDNGVGISDEYLPKIFEMFFQATDKSEGSGLGLYIVKEAVEKLGGTIEVTSKMGSGARFTVVLPKVSA